MKTVKAEAWGMWVMVAAGVGLGGEGEHAA